MKLVKLKYVVMIFFLSVVTYLINGCNTNNNLIGAPISPLNNQIVMPNSYQSANFPISIIPENYISKKIPKNLASMVSLTIRNKLDTPLKFKYGTLPNHIKSVNNRLKKSCNAINNYRLLKPYESCFLDLIIQPVSAPTIKANNYFIINYKFADSNDIAEIKELKYHANSILSLLYQN